MSDKITIVVPVSKKDISRLEYVLLPSLEIFLDKNFLKEIILIYIPSEKSKCEELKEKFLNLKIRCVNENEVSSEKVVVRWRRRGWHYQQILKLGISRFVTTEYYLILDADCVVTKSLGLSDLILDGNPIVQYGKYTGYMGRWVRESSKLLKLNYELPLMGVTPQILIKNIVIELLHYIENLYECKWDQLLARKKFTEFTLYWIFVSNNYKFTELYTDGKLFNSVGKHGFSMKELFESETCINIVQSIRKTRLQDIQRLKDYFNKIADNKQK